MKVAIITCGADKQNKKCKAKDMYKGSLFVASRKYVESVYGSNYCILSAKYNLLHPDDVIEPYDMFLGKFKKEEKQKWWNKTAQMLLGMQQNVILAKTATVCRQSVNGNSLQVVEMRRRMTNTLMREVIPLGRLLGITTTAEERLILWVQRKQIH